MARPAALLQFLVPLLVVGWAGWQGVQEYYLRLLPVPAPPLTMPSPAPGTFDGGDIALLFGLGPQAPAGEPVASHDVKAILAARDGQGVALIASAGQQHLYRVGDALPSGAVVRRIEPGRVIIWHARREHTLSLAAAPAWLATRVPAEAVPRHLRQGGRP